MDKIYIAINGITVRKLKELIMYWPEEDQYGDETEVWLSTGAHTSSPLVEICPLNKRSSEDGKEWSDLALTSAYHFTE
jgi:hypothetical protein